MHTLPNRAAVQYYEQTLKALCELLVSVPMTREDCLMVVALRDRLTVLQNEARK